jgi:hypothetical protein
VAESVNKPWGEFNFGQNKQSAWLTILALRALEWGHPRRDRMGNPPVAKK